MDEELTPRECQLLELDKRADARVPVWLCAILGPPAAALALVLWQGFVWLKSAEWPAYTLHSVGVNIPASRWLGLNELVAYVLDAPLSALLVVTGMLAAFLFTRNDSKPESEEIRTARMKQARRLRDNP